MVQCAGYSFSDMRSTTGIVFRIDIAKAHRLLCHSTLGLTSPSVPDSPRARKPIRSPTARGRSLLDDAGGSATSLYADRGLHHLFLREQSADSDSEVCPRPQRGREKEIEGGGGARPPPRKISSCFACNFAGSSAAGTLSSRNTYNL